MKTSMVILAAGLSKRMGVFKPLLPVGGQPAIMRCINMAKAAGVSDIAVVTGHLRGQLEAALSGISPTVRFVHNERYRDGMFSSVYAGVSALPVGIGGFFLLPADCCAVSDDTLLMLMDAFNKNGGKSVVRPRYGGRRGHPPLIPAEYIPGLLAYSGENGLKGFLNPLPTIELEQDGPGALLDMDTPEDFAALLQHLGLPAYPNVPQCDELLAKYDVPAHISEHGRQVAALALKIAGLLERRGAKLDTALLESACLLHDIRRMEPDHARSGMELLLREGYPKAAMLVGTHMDAPEKSVTDVGESELLYLADKLCRKGKCVKIEDTLRALQSAFAKNPEALAKASERMEHALSILSLLRERYDAGYKDFLE